MIRTFDVRLNAAHPELPLMEATAIVGSPSTANIYNVPAQIGTWDILKVFVEVSYPDGSTVVEEATKTAQGIWTATVPQCTTSGRVKSGFTVIADGEDENGEEVTGYILGVADFAVYTRGLVVRDGETVYNLRYFDTAPAAPAKGDVAPIDGVPKLYDGYTWLDFSGFNPALYMTKAETEAAINSLAAYYITYTAAGAAFPTRAALINAETVYSGGVARVPTRNDYAVVLADETHGGAEYRYIYAVATGETGGQWEAQYPIETNDYSQLANKPTINDVALSGNKTGDQLGLVDKSGGTMTGALKVGSVLGTTIGTDGNVTQSSPGGSVATSAADGSITIISSGTHRTTVIKRNNTVAETSETNTVQLPKTSGVLITAEEVATGYVPFEGIDALLKNGSKIIFGHGDILGDTYWDWEGFVGHYDGSSSVARISFPAKFGPLASLYFLADEFSTAKSYAVGDIVAYNRKLHRCTVAHSAGEWNDSHFEQTTIEAVIADVRAAIANVDMRYSFRNILVNTKQEEESAAGYTIEFEEVDVADRTANVVEVRITLDELRINIPPAVSGKVRDFYCRVVCYTPGPSVTAVAPAGETIVMESADGTFPNIEDGSADEPSVTMIYFTETAPGKFMVRGEQLKEVE